MTNTIRVELSDVYTRTRTIDLPSICPGKPTTAREPARPCGADLTKPGSVRIWQWNHASWIGHLGPATEEDEVDEGGAAVDGSQCSTSGDGWLPTVAYYCDACGQCLAEGERAALQPGASVDRLLMDWPAHPLVPLGVHMPQDEDSKLVGLARHTSVAEQRSFGPDSKSDAASDDLYNEGGRTAEDENLIRAYAALEFLDSEIPRMPNISTELLAKLERLVENMRMERARQVGVTRAGR